MAHSYYTYHNKLDLRYTEFSICRLCLLVMMLVLVYSSSFGQRLIYVDEKAFGFNDGSDWENAYVSLQDAIRSSSSNDEIWISEGTYQTGPAGDRFSNFDITHNLSIYGGFRGFEDSIDDREPGAITILSGEIGQSNLKSDNAYHILRVDNPNITFLLDGVSVQGAHGDFVGENDFELDEIGAVLIDNPIMSSMSITFRNVRFEHNYSNDLGGAVFIRDKSNSSTDIVFDGCSFHDNLAALDGSAVYAEFFSNQANLVFSRLSIDDIDPSGETYTAIQVLFRGNENRLLIEDSFFADNVTSKPDPIMAFGLFGETDFTLRSSTFVNNVFGQIMFVSSNSGDRPNTIVIEDVDILHNETFSSPLQILNTAFGQNRSDVFIDGLTIENNINGDTWILIDLHEINLVSFDNNTFIDNKGGPLFLNPIYSDLTINNLLVANNSFLDVDFTNQFVIKNFDNYDITFNNATFAYNDGVKGAAFRSFFNTNNGKISQLTFNNSIFFSNTEHDQNFNSELLVYSTYTDVHFNSCLLDATTCENTVYFENLGTVTCDANTLMDADPFFRSLDDYRLDYCSPAIDKGSNVLAEQILKDIADEERVIDGRVDMGAFESVPVTRDFGFTCSQGLLYSDWLPDFDDGATFEYIRDDFDYIVNEQGRYIITQTSGCIDTVTVDVRRLSGIDIRKITEAEEYVLGDTVVVDAINFLADEVNWHVFYNEELIPFSRDDTRISFTVRGSGDYRLLAVNQFGCLEFRDIEIPEFDLSSLLYIPNSVSPNGDGINDNWTVYTRYEGVVEIVSFSLYNRWGVRLYELSDVEFQEEYDLISMSTLDNMESGSDVLVYIMEIEVEGQSALIKGDLSLF